MTYCTYDSRYPVSPIEIIERIFLILTSVWLYRYYEITVQTWKQFHLFNILPKIVDAFLIILLPLWIKGNALRSNINQYVMIPMALLPKIENKLKHIKTKNKRKNDA